MYDLLWQHAVALAKRYPVCKEHWASATIVQPRNARKISDYLRLLEESNRMDAPSLADAELFRRLACLPSRKAFYNGYSQLIARGLEPIDTQVYCGHPWKKVFTRMDLLCYNRYTNRYTVFEIKTGGDKYRHKHTQYLMNEPFQDMTDSPFNQHQLQLAATYLWYRSNQRNLGKQFDVPMLMMADRQKIVTLRPLDNKIWSRTDAMLHVMLAAPLIRQPSAVPVPVLNAQPRLPNPYGAIRRNRRRTHV
jgi:hypothetical protein